MKDQNKQSGLTLIEMIAAMSIVLILISIVITIAVRIESRNKEQLAKGLMATLNTALSEFRDYGFEYKVSSTATNAEIEFYRSLKFPPDFSGFIDTDIEPVMENLLGLSLGNVDIIGEPNDYGDGVMYCFLRMVPASRQTIEKIDSKFTTNIDKNKYSMEIDINGRKQPFMWIVDPWGTPLRYDYYDETRTNPFVNTAIDTIRTFPLITSAGPDKQFGTSDDITNR